MKNNQDTHFNSANVASITVAHAVHDTYQAFLPPLLPILIEKLSLSNTSAGFLAALVQFPSLLQPVVGILTDRYNLKIIVALAPAITGAMMSLLGIAPGYSSIAVLLFITGISSALFHSVAPVLLANSSGNQLGRGMSFWMVGGELGRTMGPIIIVSILNYITLLSLPWLMIGGIVSSILLFFRLPAIPLKPKYASKDLHWKEALPGMLPVLVPISCIVLLRSFLDSALSTFLPTYLTGQGSSIWVAGAAYSIMEAAGVAGALLGGSISDHFGRKRILVIAALSSCLFSFLFILLGGGWAIPSLIAVGFSFLSIPPVIMAIIQEHFISNRALANGIYMAVGFVVRSIVVILLGKLGDMFGLKSAFLLSTGLLLLSIPIMYFIPGVKKANA